MYEPGPPCFAAADEMLTIAPPWPPRDFAILLIASLLTLLTQAIIFQIADTQTSGSNAQLVLFGIYDLLTLIISCIEMATFYLVVHLMMAVTQTARTKYIALQKFLLNGFLKPEELEKAVRAQNP